MSARARGALRELAHPNAAWLLVRMAAWASILPLLKRVLALPRVVGLVTPSRRPAMRDAAREQQAIRLSRILYRSRVVAGRDNCLERSLIAFRYLISAGTDPELSVGMRRSDRGYEGHVWVTVAGVPIHDDPRSLDELVQVTAFNASGGVSTVSGSGSPRAAQGPERGDKVPEQPEGPPRVGRSQS